MSPNKADPTPVEMCAFMRRLFSERDFFDALCISVQEYEKARCLYVVFGGQTITVSVNHWTDSLILLRLLGADENGGDPEYRGESILCRESFLRLLLASDKSNGFFSVYFRALEICVRIEVSSRWSASEWNFSISTEKT